MSMCFFKAVVLFASSLKELEKFKIMKEKGSQIHNWKWALIAQKIQGESNAVAFPFSAFIFCFSLQHTVLLLL